MQGEFWPSTGPMSDDGKTSEHFLPTPSASGFECRDVTRMMERRAQCKKKHKNGNGFGLTLGQHVAAESAGALTLSRAGSRAKISATQGTALDSAEREVDCFSKPFGWFDYSDQESCFLKTWQRCLLGDWTKFSGRWPRSGLMRSGIVYRLPPLVPRISATGCSSWHTPKAADAVGSSNPNRIGDLRNAGKPFFPTPYGLSSNQGQGDGEFGKAIRNWPTPTSRDYKDGTAKSCENVPENGLLGRAVHCRNSPNESVSGSLNPQWVEWLMGFPSGWTDLED